MSDNVRSTGFICSLKTPVDSEEVNERLWGEKSKLQVSYDGTIVYSDERSRDIYCFFIGDQEPEGVVEFMRECAAAGLTLDTENIRPYTCIWYDGADSPMAEMTLAEYQLS
jgi:hypothetical protein